MNDKPVVIAGLVVFIVLVTFPIWYALGAGGDRARPTLELPPEGSKCVEDKQYMAANHMDLLNQWRDAVVREGEHYYTSTSGEQHVMSLTGTCIGCHSNREAFCNRCHDYVNVEPSCWDCHVDPRGN